MANNGNEDNDDDYMGDLSLFLPSDAPTSTSQHSRKHHQPNTSETKPKRPKGVTWQEQRRLDRERKQREENERTMAGLAEAIPETNIGFKLLKRMGYNPSGSGGAPEPVGVEIRRSRAGIGAVEEREAKRKELEVKRKELEVKRKRSGQDEMETVAKEFGSMQRSKWRSRKVVSDYRKAQAVLAQLENVEVVEKEEDEEEEKGEDEEEEEVITEEDLHDILVKLRDQHCYCLYCGCQYESAESLANECPGLHEDDH